MSLYVGADAIETVSFLNAAGVLTEPTQAAVRLIAPDGTTVSPAVSLNPAGTGKRQFVYRTTQAGTYSYVVTATVDGVQDVQQFEFYVDAVRG